MRAGELDKRIALLRKATARDGKGSQIGDFVSFEGDLPAAVKTMQGRDDENGGQISNDHQVLIKIRFRTDLNERDRILYNEKQYDIQSIQEIGRREGLRIVARSR